MSTHTLEASKSTDSQLPKTANSEWLDEVFTLLSNSRRRHAIEIMMEHERINHGELVDRVAELEYGLDIDEISSDERHTVYVSLTQTHLPRLEKNEIIERDRDTGAVSLGHQADELMEFMAHEDDSLGSKLKRSVMSLC